LAENGFAPQVHDLDDLTSIKAEHKVPSKLQSCHTAIVDGYVIEGHVPATEIQRLLKERPAIHGLSVPGMPIGSPGMEIDGQPAEAYDVIAFMEEGSTSVFASYGS
jgi:hypothetical protein